MLRIDRIKPKDTHFESVEHTDPTTFSRIVLPSEELTGGEQNGKNIPTKDSALGEHFHEISKFNDAETQQFVSRLLKGFFNVSDVVNVKGVLHSYEPLIENVENGASVEEVEADITIIRTLFNDSDRWFVIPTNELGYPLKDWRNNLQTKNFKRFDGKHMFFDFDMATLFWSKFDKDKFRLSFNTHSRLVREATRNKLISMSEYFHSTQGKDQSEAAFKATGKTIDELFRSPRRSRKIAWYPYDEISFDDFYKEFLFRIDTMNAIAHEEVQENKATTPNNL